MLVCIFILSFGDKYRWFQEGPSASTQKIGMILSQDNDTRLKSNGQYTWTKTAENENIRMGDSIYSGAHSHVQIRLDKGGNIDIGESSLVSFNEVENQKMANLVGGNFRLKVDGTMKVAVNGEVTTIDGQNSEVQIFIDKKKKPVLRVLNGNVEVKNKYGKKVKLNAQNIANIDVSKVHESRKEAGIPVANNEKDEAPPKTLETIPTAYNWHIYDIYELKQLNLIERKFLPEKVDHSVNLAWTQKNSINEKSPAMIQFSKNETFENYEEFIAKDGKYILEKTFLGKNFWRVSTNEGKNWSPPREFIVNGNFLANARPMLPTPTLDIPILEESTTIEFNIQSIQNTQGFIVQASLTPDFKPDSTKLFWSPSTKPRLSFYKPGVFYYRFRSVNTRQEISNWSEVEKFNVFRPDKPLAPILAGINKKQGPVNSAFYLNWISKENKVVTKINNSKNELITTILGKKIYWIGVAPGKYKIQSYSYNKYDQISDPSKPVFISVLPEIKLNLTKNSDFKKRTLAGTETAQNTSALKIEPPTQQKPRNQKYSSSQISLQGYMWTMQSSQQVYQNESAPVAAGLGVNVLNWRDRVGIQGSIKSGVLNLNQAASGTSGQDIEARLHYRFNTKAPLHFARELQTSLFAGYEVYKNNGAVFSNQYDLIKFGTSLEFPVSLNWSAGGEFVFGTGTDKSNKNQIAGYFNYFFSKVWSLGAGYQINYFQAGSAASAASGILPYKEGYTEGFSKLNFHF